MCGNPPLLKLFMREDKAHHLAKQAILYVPLSIAFIF